MRALACVQCLDAGVVEVKQSDFKTLAICYCKQGRAQAWTLEMIPIKGFEPGPLNWREYKSTKIGTNEFVEKIKWHIQRIRNAEEFWKEWKSENALP